MVGGIGPNPLWVVVVDPQEVDRLADSGEVARLDVEPRVELEDVLRIRAPEQRVEKPPVQVTVAPVRRLGVSGRGLAR